MSSVLAPAADSPGINAVSVQAMTHAKSGWRPSRRETRASPSAWAQDRRTERTSAMAPRSVPRKARGWSSEGQCSPERRKCERDDRFYAFADCPMVIARESWDFGHCVAGRQDGEHPGEEQATQTGQPGGGRPDQRDG